MPQAGVFHLPAYVRRRAGGKHQHEANDTFLKNYSIKFVFTQPVSCGSQLLIVNCKLLIVNCSYMQKIKKIKTAYFNTHQFIRFGINGVFLFILWFIFYKFFRNLRLTDYFYEGITYYITHISLIFSKLVLNIFGYEVEIWGKTIKIINTYGVHLDRGCLGRNNIGIFTGFIIAYPGLIRTKLWYIPFGIFVFFLINSARIIALAITVSCCPQNLDFNHHVVFQYGTLGFMFLLWFIWIKFLRKKKTK